MTIHAALDAAVAQAARGVVTVGRDLHGFPGTAHGGAVAALFYRLTLPRPPVRLHLELFHGVPTETPLRLTSESAGHEARLAFWQGDRRLVGARLSREDVPAAEAGPVRAAWSARDLPRSPLPATATCLACGTANPLGLGLRLLVNERWLWVEYDPPASYRQRDGSTHPALATIALDELGWWLGALAQGECGVTTEIAITLLGALPFGPLLLVGDRSAVSADDDPRGRYCRATGYLLSERGDLHAMGTVRFAGSRAYTRRLLNPFLETSDLETLARFFPSAPGLAARQTGTGGSS